MKEFIKKNSKWILIGSFTLVFALSYYISVVGASLIIIDPERAVKASMLRTVTGGPVEVRISGALSSLGVLPDMEQEIMTMILDDIYLGAVITYDNKVKEVDFSINLRSSSYNENILEVIGFSTDDKVFFSEQKLLKKDYYFLKEPLEEESNYEELIEELLEDVSRKGLKEYKTTDGNTSYANVFEIRSVIDKQEVELDLLVNNKMEIVHIDLLVEEDGEVVLDVSADISNVDRELSSYNTQGAQLFDVNDLMDLIPEM